MLELKPNCESCDKNLLPTADACICSFECTFCMECTERMNAVCPNCGGHLIARATSSQDVLSRFPSLPKEVEKGGCIAVEGSD